MKEALGFYFGLQVLLLIVHYIIGIGMPNWVLWLPTILACILLCVALIVVTIKAIVGLIFGRR